MFDTIREWPRYVKVPFPIAKVGLQVWLDGFTGLCYYTVAYFPRT